MLHTLETWRRPLRGRDLSQIVGARTSMGQGPGCRPVAPANTPTPHCNMKICRQRTTKVRSTTDSQKRPRSISTGTSASPSGASRGRMWSPKRRFYGGVRSKKPPAWQIEAIMNGRRGAPIVLPSKGIRPSQRMVCRPTPTGKNANRRSGKSLESTGYPDTSLIRSSCDSNICAATFLPRAEESPTETVPRYADARARKRSFR